MSDKSAEERISQLEQLVQSQAKAMEHLHTQMGILEREFGCMFRMMRVQLEAQGLTSKCADIVDDWEQIVQERLALLARPATDHDEPTDPGLRRRTLTPVG